MVFDTLKTFYLFLSDSKRKKFDANQCDEFLLFTIAFMETTICYYSDNINLVRHACQEFDELCCGKVEFHFIDW